MENNKEYWCFFMEVVSEDAKFYHWYSNTYKSREEAQAAMKREMVNLYKLDFIVPNSEVICQDYARYEDDITLIGRIKL